jgi:hypothetical protein
MHREIRITKEHLTLLRNATVTWNSLENGAPTIDPKRPYGDKYVEESIAEILGWVDPHRDRYTPLSEAMQLRASEIHKEMETVLAVVLYHVGMAITPGLYRQESETNYRAWIKVEE